MDRYIISQEARHVTDFVALMAHQNKKEEVSGNKTWVLTIFIYGK